MAVDVPPTVPASAQQRTWRINIESPKEQAYTITGFRETVQYDASGNILSHTRMPDTLRIFQALIASGEPPFICADSTPITVRHLIEAAAGFCDRWAVQDANAPVGP